MYRCAGFYQKGLKANLGALCKRFDIHYDPMTAHAGDYDIIKTDEVFRKLYWNLEVW